MSKPTPFISTSWWRSSRFTCGSLVYSRATLLSVFFWMLWGDLCVNIMETIIPRLVPLHLERLEASKPVIGLVSASVLAGVELVVNPFVSTYSDRFRSFLGRRRPFILAGTPILAICLIAVGLADPIGRGLSFLTSLGLTQNQVTIITLGLLLAIFQVFNVIVLATYYYMIADVVPNAVIGKFAALYKVMGALGGIIFSEFIFPHRGTHEFEIYVGCALIYLIAFMLMGWRVKEGTYPPPPPPAAGSSLGAAVEWCKESFSLPFYLKLYSIGLCYYFALGGATFTQFLALTDLKMSDKSFGHIVAVASAIALPLYFVLGTLADKYHPLRIGMIGMALMSASGLACYVFIHDEPTFYLFTVINTVATTVYLGGQISLLPRILPLTHYGQYCSANNTLCAIGKFSAPVLCGLLIQRFDNNHLAFLWQAIFALAGVGAFYMVFRDWKSRGGDLHFQPPKYTPAGHKTDSVHRT